ncbi:MAG: hypothetical protein VKN72_03910 [Nostocales cyanobacterium 94392]|nr:hypothetical protein [Nostocales cyanobacterium 94392]
MTFLEAQKHLCRKLDIDYADIANNDLFSLEDIKTFIQLGTIKAWDYKPWDFTEGSKTATTVSDMTTNGYADYPNDFQSGSTYLLKIAGKEYKKLIFQDYLKFLEDYPDATDRVWSEQKRFIFINANAYTAGETLDLYGKLMPPILSNDADILPFSPDSDNYEHSGNEAIILLGYSEALGSEKKKNPQQAEIERGKAYQILDLLWKPFADARSLLQSKNRPFFEVSDYFGNSDNNSIGSFDYLN